MPASVSLNGIPTAIRGAIFNARFRELLLWCLPALALGAVARGWIFYHFPYGYVHPDTADFLITADQLLRRHHFVLHGKKAFLAPILFTLPLLVKIPPLLVIPWAQHLFGLIFTLMIGEPTLMKPVIGHKGKRSLRCHVHGLECHSAMTHAGVNAVEAAAEMVAYLKSLARRFRDQGPYDPDYDPPYTTVHTGHIDGGTALNIVPKHCLFDFEFRHLPEHDPEAILREIHAEADRLSIEMRQVYAQAGFDFQAMSGITGLATGGDEEIVSLVKQLTGINGAGKVSFGTEGGFYQNAGIPTVICGPGSIEQAHKPDEWIALEQVAACETFMDRLIHRIGAE